MFDYTKAIFNKTLADLKLFARIWTISTLGVYIAYLIYAIAADSGNLTANIILLALTSIYFTFYLMMIIKGSEILKSRRKIVKKSYKYSKYIINSITLSTALYSIWLYPDNVHPFKLLITVFMMIMLVVQLALEVSVVIVEKRFGMFMEAFHADIEVVTKPVNTVKNVFKKITGQEVEPEKERSKDRIYLDKLVEQARDAEATKKAQTKAERSEKISSWLDNHLSKISFKRKKEEITEIKELAPLNAPEAEVIEDETE
jgi:hypothetical protein